MSKSKIKLMLDSGAFSAWSRNEELSLKEYMAYLKEHKELCFSYVNMDKIPGKFGRARTSAEVEDSANQSYKNLQIMKDAGLHPIPVFHQDERFEWLEKMLKDGEPYIGFSSGKDNQPEVKQKWLDTVFTMITDSTGKPFIKAHGFGITRPIYLFDYPWYTVDSTTWSMTPGYGTVIVPKLIDGKFNYSVPPVNFIFSGREQKSPAAQEKQLEAVGAYKRIDDKLNVYEEALIRFITEEVGVSVEQARYDSNARRKAALIYYLNLSKHLKGITFNNRHVGLFSGTGKPFARKTASKHTHTMIMFATSPTNAQWSELLTECKADTRLLSYYETKEMTTERLEFYVKYGYLKARQRRQSVKTDWGQDSNYQNYRRLRALEKLDAARAIAKAAGEREPSAG